MSVKNLRRVSCVAAVASNLGIGNNGKLPWPSLRLVEFCVHMHALAFSALAHFVPFWTWIHYGLMVSALDSRASGPGSSPGRGTLCCVLGKTLCSQFNPAMNRQPGNRNIHTTKEC